MHYYKNIATYFAHFIHVLWEGHCSGILFYVSELKKILSAQKYAFTFHSVRKILPVYWLNDYISRLRGMSTPVIQIRVRHSEL
jgi:hypothetical protein